MQSLSGMRRLGIVYGFRIRDPLGDTVRIDYVGQTTQPLDVRDQQHRGSLPTFGSRTYIQPWSDLVVGSALIIEQGMWTAEELNRREAGHILRLRPRYNAVHNRLNPDRISRRTAVRQRDERDRASGVWRLADDVELFKSLQAIGFSGRQYDDFATRLSRWAVRKLTQLARGNVLLAYCRTFGLGGLPEPPFGALRQPDVAEELAGETVAKALHCFRENVLLRERWNPSYGGPLRTYFLGQCFIQFSNIYHRWLRDEVRSRRHVLVDDLTLLDSLLPPDPTEIAAVVTDRDEIRLRLAEMPDRAAAAAVLSADGWDQQEIADHLGTTRKSVERALAYYRTRPILPHKRPVVPRAWTAEMEFAAA